MVEPEVLVRLTEEAGKREKVLERPIVFSRAQVKYDLGINYYNTWRDRPLFNSRKWRISSSYFTAPEAWREMLLMAGEYGLDGLAFFPETKGRMDIFPLTAQAGVEGVRLLPEFIPSCAEEDFFAKSAVLKAALDSKQTVRIDGKVLITSYNAQLCTPEQWAKMLDRLKKVHGDTFLFLPALSIPVELRVTSYEEGQGKIGQEDIEEVKSKLRAYLDVCDGIYFHYPPALRNKDGSFDDDFYRNVLIKVMKSVLAEPVYKEKLLGLSAYRAHLNPDYGNNLSDDLTRTLRRSFEAAMEADPDVMVLPEWDEFNENTCFMPTVYTGTSTKRILRYYMQKIKGVPHTPLSSDDPSIPNLILSTRKIVVLGEILEFELLNVPDTEEEISYTVELSLSDENGNVLKKMDAVEFSSTTLKEHRLRLPSEEFAQARAIIPGLVIRKKNGEEIKIQDGLYPIQLRATWNWDLLAVKQPIRDVMRPEKVEIAWTDDGISVALQTTEELSYVEITGDAGEVYTFDPHDEFFRNNADRELYLIEYRAIDDSRFEGRVSLKNGKGTWWHDTNMGQHSRSKAIHVSESEITFQSDLSKHQRVIYLAAEKSENTVLELDFGGNAFEIPLKEIRERKIVAQNFPNGLHVTISPFAKQFDLPQPLEGREANFTVPVWPEIGTEQFVLQAIARSGRIYRSRPLLLPVKNTESVPLRIYSKTQQRGMNIEVSSDRIPHIQYAFEPKRGAVLVADAGRPFWASLGGFANAIAGKGMPVNLAVFQVDDVVKLAPEWKEMEGKTYLEFDGSSSYIHLPKEFLPNHGSFEMKMKIRPDASNESYNLLAAHLRSKRVVFSLRVEKGKLVGTYVDSDWKVNSFRTPLKVPVDQWSEIKVSYDFEKMRFSVNGETAVFDSTFPAAHMGYGVFGIVRKGSPAFSGLLESLEVKHHYSSE